MFNIFKKSKQHKFGDFVSHSPNGCISVSPDKIKQAQYEQKKQELCTSKVAENQD